jgi:nitroimidazol reductase NimA-like FMN-containing flavoprotein (pyridoxamine 5'-phosphate oxidase superfamily)
MRPAEHWFPGRLTEMPAGECRDLMGSTSVGRVALVDEDGPVVLPVNYVLDGDTVLFRTSPANSIARHLDDSSVAFEVDEFDDYTQSGWSVLVRGVASFEETDELARDERPRPVPWVDGVRTLLVRITPTSISGRRLLPG